MSAPEWLLGHSDHEADGLPPLPYQEPGTRKVALRPLAAYKPQAVEWLWRERIPAGELTLLVGDGGLGKSTFLARLAAEVTAGNAVGLNGTQDVVVVLGEDDPARVLQARYRAAGADMAKVSVLAVDAGMGDEPVSLPDEIAMVADEIALNRPDLLIVDPLGAHLNASVDAHRDGGKGGVRTVLGPLSRIAQKYGTTIVCAVHLNKGSGPAASRIAGSAGFRNAARNVLVLAAHPEAREGGDDNGLRILGHDKSNVGAVQASLEVTVSDAPALSEAGVPLLRRDGQPATTSVVTIGDESDVDYEQALRSASENRAKGDGEGGALADAVDFVRDALGDGPISSRKLESMAADAGIAKRTLRRAREELDVKTAKVGTNWAVSLPKSLGTLGILHELPVKDGDSGPVKDANAAKSAKGATPQTLATLDNLRPGSDGEGA